MPYQDLEEVSTTEYSPPGVFEAWFRRILVEDWRLKLLALAIALLLWLAVTGVNKPQTIRTGVQLNFITPNSMEISNDPPRTVDALLTGRRSKLDSISHLDLVATVDVNDLREGERVVRLLSDRVKMDLPEGVRIDSFEPSILAVHLEPIVERQIEVEVKFQGKPEEGYEIYAVRSAPGRVKVRGPVSHINRLPNAPTETISLAGIKEGFSASQIAIDIPDPKVDLVDSTVDVTVDIGERRQERTFTRVSVTSSRAARPLTAAVTLIGPASVMSQLRLEDLKVVLTSDTLEPRLILPAGILDRVTLKSITPSQFSLRR